MAGVAGGEPAHGKRKEQSERQIDLPYKSLDVNNKCLKQAERISFFFI